MRTTVLQLLGALSLVSFGLETRGTELVSFNAGNGGWHMGTLACGNLDDDPRLEIVVPYRDLEGQWHLDAFNWNGTRIAGFPYSSGYEEMNTSPTLYDLDDDGKLEIIITRGNKVVALRGDGSVLWSSAVTYQNYIPNSGFQTVAGGFYWTSDQQWHPTLPPDTVFSSQFSSPIVADFDGNGSLEIATAWKIDPDPNGGEQDYNPFINDIFGFAEWGTVGESWSGGVVFLNAATGAKTFIYHIHQLVEAGLGVGQADSDGSLETYVLNDSDSIVCFDKTKPFGLYGNGQLHKMFGKNLRMTTGFYKQGIDVYPADVDGDGLHEVLSVTTQVDCLWQPHESMLDDDGALTWRKWKQAFSVENNNGWFNSACMFAVNPDHDNRIDTLSFTHSNEINFRTWNGINFGNRPGWPKTFGNYLPSPPVVGNVDADSEEEIVIGTYDPARNPSTGALYVFALDGTVKHRITIPGGVKHIPSLADVDADGSLDVVYRSLSGRVYVQNFGATSATNVSWATHRGTVRRDGRFYKSLFPPNTPLITKKVSGTRKAHFAWGGAVTNVATEYRIYRAANGSAPLQYVSSVPADVHSFTDAPLSAGWQYFYEVAAVVEGKEIRSSPFAILSSLENNLVENSGFEENSNSHWDKWDTGDLTWTNMCASTNAWRGKKSMQVTFRNQGTTDTLNQYAQYGTPRSYMKVKPGALYSFGGVIRNGGFNVPTTHWFEWTTSLNGEYWSERPSMPYPNYFTPQLYMGTTATPWRYLNRVFEMPSGIPTVEIRHRMSTDSAATGTIWMDDVFFRELPSMDDSRWQNLVWMGSNWKYFSDTPPWNWYTAAFNDTGWPQGRAKLGCGSGPINIATPLPANKAAYYFRKRFSLNETNLQELLLTAACTDDYGGRTYPLRLWLNGREIMSSGIATVSSEGNEVKYFDLTPFQHLLKAGQNTIAIRLSNTFQSTWDNVAFDVGLKAIPMAAE